MNEIYQIYDKIFKRILTLSDKAVILFINGLFGTDYPENSSVTYNWTESIGIDLRKTLADSILTINNKDSYHIEAQMTEDEEIVFRIFEYGYGHAYRNRRMEDGEAKMEFPCPCIVYLAEGKKESMPDEYKLHLNFKDQGEFVYTVPVVKVQNNTPQELEDKKLIVLLPFMLLKLKKKIEKIRTKENVIELQKLVMNDTIGLINKNKDVGNITKEDAINLIDMTKKLYFGLYEKYEELGVITTKMHDESIELAGDRYARIMEAIEEKEKFIKEQDETIKEQDKRIIEQDEKIRMLEASISELKEAVAGLKA